MCIPCFFAIASLLGILLPERPPLERLAAFLLLAAAALSILYTRTDAGHRPVRNGLLVITAIDSANAGMKSILLTGGPYFGALRVAFHIHEALTLASLLVLPLVAVALLSPDRRGAKLLRTLSLLVGGVALVHLVTAYPAVRELALPDREEWLRLRYLGTELVALFAAAAVILGARPTAKVSRISDTVVRCLLVGRLALLAVGAWGRGLFGAPYSIHQAGFVGLYLVLVAVYARSLREDGRRPA